MQRVLDRFLGSLNLSMTTKLWSKLIQENLDIFDMNGFGVLNEIFRVYIFVYN